MAENTHNGLNTTRREPVAELRKRFVRRANNLRTHPPFRDALNDAIGEWNQRYPAFRLATQRGIVSDDVVPGSPGYLYPPMIQSAMGERRSSILLSPGFSTPPGRKPTQDELKWDAAAQVFLDWHSLLERLWLTWWPPEYFHVWPLGLTNHPAQRFVSACLLWNPKSIEADEWIEKQPLQVGRTFLNISRVGPPTPDAEEAYYRVLYQETTERLLACIRAGETITEQVIEREAWAAHETAKRARWEAWRVQSSRAYPYIWIWPEMTRQDWRDLERPALEAARGQPSANVPSDWRTIARRLYADGMNKNQIALALGVYPQRVQRALDEYQPA